MAEKAGKHRESGKHFKRSTWANRRHHVYWVCGHALYEIGLGGAAIVLFEWIRPVSGVTAHNEALVEVIRNVQF